MKDGAVVGWSNKGDENNGWTSDGYGTAVLFPGATAAKQKLRMMPQCGIHDCKK